VLRDRWQKAAEAAAGRRYGGGAGHANTKHYTIL